MWFREYINVILIFHIKNYTLYKKVVVLICRDIQFKVLAEGNYNECTSS